MEYDWHYGIGEDEWRRSNGIVINIRGMNINHLRNSINLAERDPTRRSRLNALYRELEERITPIPIPLINPIHIPRKRMVYDSDDN